MEQQLVPDFVVNAPRDSRIVRDYLHPNQYELVPYLLRDGRKHKVAIICPGGGYTMVCSYVEGEPFAKALNALGFSAVVVYYRCREKARYPAPQEDLARAVREVHRNAQEWNLDTKGYSIWGSSAGGHLAASFGTEAMGYPQYDLPKPGALILTYPVITMTDLTHRETRQNLLGKSPTPEEINRASIEQQITAAYPPTYLWCGDADATVSPENSRMLNSALEKAGVPHQFQSFPGIGHGAGLAKDTAAQSWFANSVQFWMEHI